MKKLPSALFVYFLSSIFYLLILPSPALAQINQNPNAVPSTKGWVIQHPAEYTKTVRQDNTKYGLSSSSFGLRSWSELWQQIWFTIAGETEPDGTTHGGAVNFVGNSIASLYGISPISSVQYIAYVGQNLGLVKPAYAQDTVGKTALSPILPLWQKFRDVAYLMFIIIFIVIGLMIMFRRKLDPQTVISIQNSIPRITLALLLVTFSYAIVGLFVDTMQLTINIGTKFMFEDFVVGGNAEVTNIQQDNVFNLINPIRNSWALKNFLDQNLNFDFGPAGEGEGSELVKLIAGLSVKAIIWIAGLFVMFKIFFMLIMAWAGVILNTLFAPIRLLLMALPGNTEIGDWIRDLISHLVVFPVTFFLLFIAALLLAPSGDPTGAWNIDTDKAPTFSWAPTLIGNKWGAAFGPLISLGILFTIPAVAKVIQDALKVKPSPAEGAIREQISAGTPYVPFIGSYLKNVM